MTTVCGSIIRRITENNAPTPAHVYVAAHDRVACCLVVNQARHCSATRIREVFIVVLSQVPLIDRVALKLLILGVVPANAIKSEVMRAHRTSLLAYRASSMATDCIVSRAPCCHAGEFRAIQSQEVIALARRDSLAGRSSSSFPALRLMSHGLWAGCHEPKGTDGFHTRTSAKIQPRLLNMIKASTNLDDLLTIIEKNHSYLNAAAVRESLQKAVNLEQKQGRSLSRSVRDRQEKVVSQHLERHMTDRISDYSAFDLASCAHKLAKMRLGGNPTFQAIEKEAIIKLADFNLRGLVNLLWAFAKAEEKAPRLFQAVEAHLLHSHPELLKEFKPQELSNLVYAYAKAEEKAPRLFEAVEAHLHSHPELLKKFTPQGFSNVVWAFAKAEEKAPRLFQAVEAHLHSRPELLKGFTPQGFSNVVWAFATAEEKAPRLFKAVEAHLHSRPELLKGFTPQNISNLVWAYAKAGEGAPRLFQAVEAHLHSRPELLKGFTPQNISNLVWAYATVGKEAPRLFQAVEAHLHSHPGLLKGFTPQGFSNLVQAYAKAEEKAPRLFQAVEAHLHSRPELLKGFTPQNISNLVWAYEKAGEGAPRLFQAVEAHLHSRPELLKGFTPQNISNLVWAYAKAGEGAPRLFQAVEAHLHSRPELLKGFTPQNISNLVWAYAKAGEGAPRLFQAVEAHLHSHPDLLKEFDPQGFSNVVWAYATVGEEAPRLFQAVVDLLQNNPGLLRSFDPQNISNLVWVCAEQRHDAPVLFDLISKQVVHRLDEFSPQGLSMTARAYAVLYHPGAETIIQAALQRTVRDPSAFNPQDLVNILNAAAVVEKLDEVTIKVLASAMASMELQDEAYRSVYHSCLGLQLSCPDSLPASLLPAPMHDSARHLWQKQAKDVRSSELQKDVLRVLSEEMGLKCHPEWMTPDGNFSVDIMVELPGDGGRITRVAVEVDGPSHFTSTQPYKALGATRLKRQLLEARVDHVASVPFYEWDEAAKSDDPSAKKRLLERIIFTSGK